jgi:hypothetical protein
MKFRTSFVGILLGLCVNGALVWGQESRAVISGSVSDPQGAAVPGAKVEAKNLETNVVITVQTNERGLYTVPPVNPGQYSVTVSAPGFKTTVQSNVELRIADHKGLDFKLELGATTETVTVTAEAPLMDTQSSMQGTVINKELVQGLPTIGRDIFDLVQFTAGVQTGGRSTYGMRPFDGGENNASIQGGGGNTNEVLLDGSPNTHRETSAAAQVTIVPPPEAVGEIKILTNVYDAEYGRTGGGVMVVALKSGTKDFHGSAWWYWRNDILNANTFESNAKGAAKTAFRLNQPGAQLQGPVRFPGIYDGRDRTFFMYSIDIFRDSRPQVSNMVVPTDLQKQGDFSQTYVSGTSGPTVTIYDPTTTTPSGSGYTRMPFPNNKVPYINPIAAKVLPLFLKPDPGIVARGQPNLLVTPNKDIEPYNVHVFKLDQVLNVKHRFFVNVGRSNRHQTNGLGLALSAYQAAGHPYASSSYMHWRINHSLTFNLTSFLSPTFLSTARVSWNRHEFAIDNYSFKYDPAALGFPGSLVAQTQSKSFPSISFGSGFSQIGGWYSGGNILNFSDTWSVGETLSKVIGEHSLKFGGEARLMLNNQSSLTGFASISFSPGFTQANPLVSSASSGDGFASFLLGYPSSLSSDYYNLPAQGQRYYGLFFQDDWRLTRKLTLNLGLRWDYESPVTDRYDRYVRGFDPTTVTNLGSATGPQIKGGLLFADSNHRLPYKRDLNNIGPRVGYAYQVSSKLVLRGGWAITYAPTATIPPTTGFSISTSPSTSVAAAGLVPITLPGCSPPSCGMLSNPFPDGILRPRGRSLGLQTNVGQSISYVWPDRTVPYSHSFSTGFQYELPFRSLVEISYNGRRSRQLATSKSLNSVTYAQYLANGSNLTGVTVANPYAGLLPGTSLNGATMTLQQSLLPYPQFTGITESGRSIGTSRYDSLEVRFEKRLSSGLTVLFTGTFAKGTNYSSYLNSGMDAMGQFIARDAGSYPYTVNLSGSYRLPFFYKATGLTRALLGGWQLAGTAHWVAGGIIGVSGATSTGLDPAIPDRSCTRWFNTCTYNNNTGKRQNCASDTEPVAWIIQKPFTLLTQPEPQWGSVRGRIAPVIDFSLSKSFSITERLRMELRVESFNAVNTPQFASPNMSATSSLFGVTTLTQTNMPHNTQLSLRLSF